jgi:branched-chain amino acid aminotransferase
MRDIFINHNGKLVKADAPIIGAQSRGLRYGDGLFETIKLKDGQLLHADEHFARLWQGLQLLQFAVPRQFSPTMLEDQILTLAQKNRLPSARVRLTVYRGNGGLYDPQSHAPQYIIEATELPQGNGAWNSNGLVLGMYADVRKSCDLVANIKHNNYLPYLMAALHAKTEKWNDAIVLNTHGRICDTTIANIFMVKDQMVITPALAEGCVAGVMRKQVLALLRQHPIEAQERAIEPAELLQADEVFVTNAIYGLRWVQQVNDAMYGNGLTQKIYSLLQSTI